MKNGYSLLLAVISLSMMVGCGSQNTPNASGSSDAASVGDRGDVTKAQALCNRATQGDVDIKLIAMKDANGNVRNSFVRMQFLHVPDSYIANNYDIEIRKSSVSLTGVKKPADGEAPFYANVKFEYKQGDMYSDASSWGFNSCSNCPTLDWHNMQIIAQNKSLTYTNANTFFANFTLQLDLEDVYGEWKTLEIVFMNGSTPVSTTKILIPTFDVNPEDYQLTHASALNALHPFISMVGQGFTTNQFATFANANCF